MRGRRERVVVGVGLLLAIVAAACAEPSAEATDAVGVTQLPDTIALEAAPALPAGPVTAQPVVAQPADVRSLPAAPVPELGAAAPSSADAGAVLRHATFAFTGDTLLHSPLVRAAQVAGGGFEFSPMFDRVAPILSAADLAVCHLETPIAPPGKPLSTYPLYGVPAEIATDLGEAGYDRCSTASNHSLDRGVAGVDATIDALEAAGLGHAGTARSPSDAVAPIIDVGGIAVAHLSYTYGLNGLLRPRDELWRANLIDDGTIVDDARAARARGAQVVIVSLHWGREGHSEPSDEQLDIANVITASAEVDLVIGHHAHVPQPIAQVNGTWVVYGMGNFLSNMPLPNNAWPASSQDGMIVTVTVSEQPDGSFAVDRPVVTPTWVDRDHGWVIRPVVADLADPSVPEATKARLRQSLDRAASIAGDFLAAS